MLWASYDEDEQLRRPPLNLGMSTSFCGEIIVLLEIYLSQSVIK